MHKKITPVKKNFGIILNINFTHHNFFIIKEIILIIDVLIFEHYFIVAFTLKFSLFIVYNLKLI